MSAESVFLGEISKLKRRGFTKFIYRILLWASVIFLGSCTILFFIAMSGFSSQGNYGSWSVTLIGISLIAAIIVVILGRKNFQSFIIDIDTRLKLRESISTAYEYQRSGNKSVFSELLMQDAAAKLSRLYNNQIFPAKFTLLHLILIVMIITNVALYSRVYFPAGFISMSGDQRSIEKAGTLVRDYTRSRIEDNKVKNARHNNVYANKLEQLSKTLNDRSITQDQLFFSLNRHLKEIQAEQTRLAAELDARLKDARIGDIPIQNIPNLEKLTPGKLEKLKMLLNKASSNRIPDSINQNIETMQELFSMEKLLSQIIEDLQAGGSDPNEFTDSKRDQTRMSRNTNDSNKTNGDTKNSETSGEFSKQKRDLADSAGRRGSDQSHTNGLEVPGELGLPQGHSPQAGNAKSGGREKPGTELEKVQGPGIQDKVMSAQVKQYLVRIRSLTAIGESRLKEEEIIRMYQQEIEGILQKEDIPLNYREYIKHYFLSIGIETAYGFK